AERCGGFDWRDEAFDAAYADLEHTLFGSARTYVALAPVVGLSAGSDADLGGDIRLRPAAGGEISQLWPEALGLMPPEFGRDVDRLLVLELRGALDRWELSLFSDEPFRSGQLREAIACLLGAGEGLWAATMRTAVLLADKTPERSDLVAGLNAERLDRVAYDAVRRALVEVLMHGARTELVEALDETLLGLRPRPQSVLRVA